MVGMALVVNVNTDALPLQPLAVGITEIEAVPTTLGENPAMFPDPLVANPIAPFEFVQL